MANETVNLEEHISFKYNNFKRFLIIMAFCFICLLGGGLILIDNWFAIIIGILFITYGLIIIIDISLFKALIFRQDYIVKEWYFVGSNKIDFKDLEVGVVKRIWTGSIFFNDKNRSSFTRLIMQFEIFPIGNKGFDAIKKILIHKKIIKGDEYEWNS
jgi:hypothetical protein